MAINTTNLLFISSILVVFTLTNAVSNSDVSQVCSKTFEPNFCQTTLKSDPSWSTTDMHGLGQISLTQATNRANSVPQYLASVSARAPPDLAAKYAACSKDFEIVIAKLNEAVASFKGGNVGGATQAVNAALGQIGVSLDRLKQPPMDPSQFKDLSADVQTLCQASVAVFGLLGR